ncbi:rhamnogalacturonan acetylesterase [Sphingobacterium paramultivorum]|jgi:lysophospholipase L1-like esterase|uniref:Rhamnogalacturonan acetylesterase n=2 Tax=Sphingobacterium TaxID=28453 RepID=A0A7G5E8P1_9SPHI|nr:MULTISPECIES: rhamnogalacturonan acetylesterase [Sphingobacterium]QMV70366.1 rhamnogalacturonan acetylesterase [Sphingobacterium paramultivorum]WSO14220.1 rhamnogalacturonan acetylesterase [Sphingobacterium paramultivorum]
MKHTIKWIGMALTAVLLISFAKQQDRPTIYLIGDSTVKNSNKEYWGWGTLIPELLDTTRIRVDNHAMAGRSTRTFVKEGRWAKVDSLFKPGDFLLIQFGHNEGSKPDTSKQGYRGVLRGIGQDSVVLDWGNGKKETVHTYGENLRRFVIEAKKKGVTPILLSMIPRNQWDNQGKVKRADNDFGLWARQIAEEQGVPFLDLNSITADKYDQLGAERVKSNYFPGDHTHTNKAGARENALSVIEGFRRIKSQLVQYIK